LGVETENSVQEIPSPTGESYLPISAILLGASSARDAQPLGFSETATGASNIAKLPDLLRKP